MDKSVCYLSPNDTQDLFFCNPPLHVRNINVLHWKVVINWKNKLIIDRWFSLLAVSSLFQLKSLIHSSQLLKLLSFPFPHFWCLDDWISLNETSKEVKEKVIKWFLNSWINLKHLICFGLKDKLVIMVKCQILTFQNK